MNKAFVFVLAAFYACGAFFCAAVCNASDCRVCRDEPVVVLTYPEPYDGEERVRQRVTIGVAFPAPPPRNQILLPPPKPEPRPVGPPPRPVTPPPRPRWIWW